MDTIRSFRQFTDQLPAGQQRMPALFIGHGSPMNGIQDTVFSRGWKGLGEELPKPKAVLVVSAHWLSRGTKVTAMDFPPTIHDFSGFPPELSAVQYPAPGDPALAASLSASIPGIEEDHDWGLDHGAWTVVRHMYPDASIPVLQLSIDYTRSAEAHYAMARELRNLRDKGILIIGSGNMVHNLRMVAWDQLEKPEYGYDWAIEMNEKFKDLIAKGDHKSLLHFEQLGRPAQLSIPTPEHYLPLIYTLGLQHEGEQPKFFNDAVVGGSLTMTSVQLS